MKRDFLSISDWSADELLAMLQLSARMKEYPANYYTSLSMKSVAMIFEKQSLRTHVTFDVATYQLGAHSIYLTNQDISLGKRETVHDVAKNVEHWVDGLVVRTYAHKNVVDLAKYSTIPIINALTDFEHPCQALADYMTFYEVFGTFKGKKLAFVGDGNNVCHSLMLMGAKLGVSIAAVVPKGYEPDAQVVKESKSLAKKTGSEVLVTHDPAEGLRGAHAVYTDVWASMGQEAEAEQRKKVFAPYQVNSKLMKLAHKEAIFMHCLPAHRGDEVTDEVMDSERSVVFQEAENRLHTEKALLYTLLKD